MTRLLRAELRKLLSTKLWWGMLLGAAALSAIGVIAQIASNGVRDSPLPPLSNPVTQRSIFSSADAGHYFSLIVGIILITTEFRHFTSRPTFLVEPRRWRVIVAKLVVALGLGIVYGAACAAIALAIALPWLSIDGVHMDLIGSGVLGVMLGTLASVAIFAVVGVGVGVILQNQISAVIAALAYVLILEPLLAVIPGVKEAYRYFPGAAAAALTSTFRNAVLLLEPWQGGLLLFGWGLLFAFLGTFFTLRRDIP